MGNIEDNQWVDMIIDKIGFALTKVDETIQKSIELWTELTKDIYDDQPKRDITGQTNNGQSGEEDSPQDKSFDKVKERPIQHWAMCLGEVKESPSQHWDMCASKVPESLNQEQGDDNCCDDYNEEKEEDMWELNLGTSVTSYRPNSNHHHKEEASWKYSYELLKDVDTPSQEENESWHDDYDEEEEKSLLNTDDTSSEISEESWDDDQEEEDSGSSLRRKGGYELLKSDDTCSKEDDSSWDNEEVMERMRKYRMVSDLTKESLVDHEEEDENDVSDKLQRFVNVKEEVETLSTECDWVYVMH